MRHMLSGLFVCVLLGATPFAHAHPSNEVVATEKGVVIGSRNDAGRQFLGRGLQQHFVCAVGDQQPRMMGGDGEGLRHLAETALGVLVHQPDHQRRALRRQGGDTRFLCHTGETRQPADV